MRWVTIDRNDTAQLLGVEQHGYIVPAVLVTCRGAGAEPAYHAAGARHNDLPVVELPDTRLTRGGLVEAVRIYLRRSGEHGHPRTPEVVVEMWTPMRRTDAPLFDERGALRVGVFLLPGREVCCAPPDRRGALSPARQGTAPHPLAVASGG